MAKAPLLRSILGAQDTPQGTLAIASSPPTRGITPATAHPNHEPARQAPVNAVAKGDHLPTVVLVDGSTTITLREALITRYSRGDSPNAKNTTRTQNITFNFAKITYTVDGVTTCFNVKEQTRC